jgi:hypothetical protein
MNKLTHSIEAAEQRVRARKVELAGATRGLASGLSQSYTRWKPVMAIISAGAVLLRLLPGKRRAAAVRPQPRSLLGRLLALAGTLAPILMRLLPSLLRRASR